MKVSESITTLVQDVTQGNVPPRRYLSRAQQKFWNGNYSRVIHLAISGTPAASIPGCAIFYTESEDMGQDIAFAINGAVNQYGKCAFIIHEGTYGLDCYKVPERGSSAKIDIPDCVLIGDGEVVFKIISNAPQTATGEIIGLEITGENSCVSGLKIDANKANNATAKITGISAGTNVLVEDCEFVGCDVEVQT